VTILNVRSAMDDDRCFAYFVWFALIFLFYTFCAFYGYWLPQLGSFSVAGLQRCCNVAAASLQHPCNAAAAWSFRRQTNPFQSFLAVTVPKGQPEISQTHCIRLSDHGA
jgi:hypothetical protein